jgi:hypothetical protein
LKPLLKGAFTAFSKLLGHIRFFYMLDEIWDGKSSLDFSAEGKRFIAAALGGGVFYVHIAGKDFHITDEL